MYVYIFILFIVNIFNRHSLHKINSYLIASFNKHLFTDHPFVLNEVRQYQMFCYGLHLLQNHPLKFRDLPYVPEEFLQG